MSDFDSARAILSSRDPWSVRSERLRALTAAAVDDRRELVLAIAAEVARDARGRKEIGNTLGLLLAEHTPGDEPLDPRIDAVIGLVPSRLQARLYPRIPPARLGVILDRAFVERPPHDEAMWAHAMIAALRWAPAATPAFVAYLQRQKAMKRIASGGDCHASFAALCASSPEAAQHAPKAKPLRPSGGGASLTIAKVRVIRSVSEAEALDPTTRAQLLGAIHSVTGKRVASLDAGFASTPREGERLEATQYEVREGDRARYDLFTFFGDTGVLYGARTEAPIDVAWIQGSFEAKNERSAPLVAALQSARWIE